MLVRIKILSLHCQVSCVFWPALCACKCQGIWANICIEYLTLWPHAGQSGACPSCRLLPDPKFVDEHLDSQNIIGHAGVWLQLYLSVYLWADVQAVTRMLVVVPSTTIYLSLYHMVFRRWPQWNHFVSPISVSTWHWLRGCVESDSSIVPRPGCIAVSGLCKIHYLGPLVQKAIVDNVSQLEFLRYSQSFWHLFAYICKPQLF